MDSSPKIVLYSFVDGIWAGAFNLFNFNQFHKIVNRMMKFCQRFS